MADAPPTLVRVKRSAVLGVPTASPGKSNDDGEIPIMAGVDARATHEPW